MLSYLSLFLVFKFAGLTTCRFNVSIWRLDAPHFYPLNHRTLRYFRHRSFLCVGTLILLIFSGPVISLWLCNLRSFSPNCFCEDSFLSSTWRRIKPNAIVPYDRSRVIRMLLLLQSLTHPDCACLHHVSSLSAWFKCLYKDMLLRV